MAIAIGPRSARYVTAHDEHPPLAGLGAVDVSVGGTSVDGGTAMQRPASLHTPREQLPSSAHSPCTVSAIMRPCRICSMHHRLGSQC